MMRKIKLVLLPTACLMFAIFISGCAKKEEGKSTSGKNVVSVKMTTVKRGDIKESISLTGDIHGDKEVKVYAKVPGKLIKKVKNEGDRVKKDDVIALIDRDEPALEFSEAEVKSPIDGIVTAYFLDLGDAVSPYPGTPVADVADMDNVKIFVYLGEKDMGKVEKGQHAKITVDSCQRVFSGMVNKIAPAADPQTRKLKVEITVPNPEHLLKPGTFARVEIIFNEHKNVMLLPGLAVLQSGGDNIVFVEENGLAKAIKVATGAEDEENIEIKEGLKEGQEVIVEGNYGLIEGTPVEVQE